MRSYGRIIPTARGKRMNGLDNICNDCSDRISGAAPNIRSLLFCAVKPKRMYGYAFKGKIYPDGSFGIGRLQRKTRGAVDLDYDAINSFANESIGVLGLPEYINLKRISAESRGEVYVLPGTTSPAPLDLTNGANSHKRAARGSNGLTKHGRRLITNVLDEQQRRYGRNRLAFGTFTVPDVLGADYTALCDKWSEIVRQFVQRLARMLRRCGLPQHITGVVEIQPKRLIRTGQAYPHLHLVWIGRFARAAWSYTPAEYRAAWLEVLHHHIGQVIDTSAPVGENVQPVKKSVSSYLSKYLSKGYRSLPVTSKSCDVSFIKSWYICSLSWRKWFHRATLSVSGSVAEFLVSAVEANWFGFIFSSTVQIEQGDGFDRPVTVGWYGKLRKSALKDVKGMLVDAN